MNVIWPSGCAFAEQITRVLTEGTRNVRGIVRPCDRWWVRWYATESASAWRDAVASPPPHDSTPSSWCSDRAIQTTDTYTALQTSCAAAMQYATTGSCHISSQLPSRSHPAGNDNTAIYIYIMPIILSSSYYFNFRPRRGGGYCRLSSFYIENHWMKNSKKILSYQTEPLI